MEAVAKFAEVRGRSYQSKNNGMQYRLEVVNMGATIEMEASPELVAAAQANPGTPGQISLVINQRASRFGLDYSFVVSSIKFGGKPPA